MSTPRTDAVVQEGAAEELVYIKQFEKERLEREVESLSAQVAEQRELFQRETLRTSELSQMLNKFVEEHRAIHEPGPWSRSCTLCSLVVEAKTLLLKPINAAGYAEKLEAAEAQVAELKDMLGEARMLMGCHLGGQEMTGSHSSLDKPMQQLCVRIAIVIAAAKESGVSP